MSTTIQVEHAKRVLAAYESPVPSVGVAIDWGYTSHFWAAAFRRAGMFYAKGKWSAPRPRVKPLPMLPLHLRQRIGAMPYRDPR